MQLIDKDLVTGACAFYLHTGTEGDNVSPSIMILCPLDYNRDLLTEATKELGSGQWYATFLEIYNDDTRVEVYACAS